MKEKKTSKDENLEDLVDSDEEDDSEEELSDEEDFADENFFDDSFVERNSSPSLGRIAFSGGSNLENHIFVSGGSDSDENKNDDDSFRYGILKNEEDEKKYASYSSNLRDVSNIEMENLGRNSFRDRGDAVGFVSSMNVESKNPMYEKKSEVGNIDVDNLGRENPFEKKEKKYDARPKSF